MLWDDGIKIAPITQERVRGPPARFFDYIWANPADEKVRSASNAERVTGSLSEATFFPDLIAFIQELCLEKNGSAECVFKGEQDGRLRNVIDGQVIIEGQDRIRSVILLC